MSILLAINTATQTTEIAILRDGEVIKEDSWEAKANESDLLLPYLRDSLKELSIQFKDIDALFITKGPGPFTALRVGITIVNTLAFLLNIPVYAMDTFEMVSLRSNLAAPYFVVLPAGGKSVFWDKFPERYNTPEIAEEPSRELPHAESNLSLGEMLSKQDFSKFKKYDMVEPLYIKAPNISKPKK